MSWHLELIIWSPESCSNEMFTEFERMFSRVLCQDLASDNFVSYNLLLILHFLDELIFPKAFHIIWIPLIGNLLWGPIILHRGKKLIFHIILKAIHSATIILLTLSN